MKIKNKKQQKLCLKIKRWLAILMFHSINLLELGQVKSSRFLAQ